MKIDIIPPAVRDECLDTARRHGLTVERLTDGQCLTVIEEGIVTLSNLINTFRVDAFNWHEQRRDSELIARNLRNLGILPEPLPVEG